MEATNNTFGMLIYCALLFAVIYIFILRPNKKRADEVAKMQSALRVGDRVIIAGGLVGFIKKLDGDRVKVELAKGMDVEVLKSAIIGLDKNKGLKNA